MTDLGGPLFRNQMDVLRHNFCEAYRHWRKVAETDGIRFTEVERAWDFYCAARDAYLVPTKSSDALYR